MTRPRVFLSYARPDERQVGNLYARLASAGFDPWMDRRNLLGGQQWEAAIEEAIEASDFFLACLSHNSVERRGVLQSEVRTALDLARRRFSGDVYLIPVWIGPGEVPADRVRRELADYHWVSLSTPDGWSLLVRSMRQQLRQSGGALAVPDAASAGEGGAGAFPASDFVDALVAELDDENREQALESIAELTQYLAWSDAAVSERQGVRLLEHLRQKGWLAQVGRVSEACLRAGAGGARIRCYYADYLLTLGAQTAALEILEPAVASASSATRARMAELKARAWTERFLAADVKSTAKAKQALEAALDCYRAEYQTDSQRNLIHGARAASLLRASGFHQPALAKDDEAQRLATEVLGQVEDKLELEGQVAMRDCAAAVEACLVVGREEDAATWVQRLLEHPTDDLGIVADLERHLVELWLLDAQSSPGSRLLPALRAKLLPLREAENAGPAASRSPRPGGPVTFAGGAADPAGRRAEDRPDPEKTLAAPAFRTTGWLSAVLERCAGVARIESREGGVLATGFVVRGSDLHASLGDEPVLLTAAYVITSAEIRDKLSFQALDASQALARFTALSDAGAPSLAVAELVWTSPPEALDTTIVRLAGDLSSLRPLRLAVSSPAPGEMAHLAGHPGGDAALSISSGPIVGVEASSIRHRCESSPGSGGSPLFNDGLELLALHHRRHRHQEFGEAVPIDAIREALAASV